MYFIYTLDYILLPIYILIFWLILNTYFKKRHGSNKIYKAHFNRALILKFIGCITIGMIYEYYYNGAYDGRFYFECGKLLSQYIIEYPSEFFNVMFSDLETFNATNKEALNTYNVYVYADESFNVAKIAAVFNIFSFNSFLPNSLFFCVIAFIGIWNLFIFFIKEYNLTPKIAGLCSLYIPSVIVWGSGIFKDTITFTALLWFFICTYYVFIKPRKLISNSIGLVISAFFIIHIKVYIIAAIVPFMILYIFNSYKNKIKHPTLKKIATPFILLLIAGSILLFLQNANEMLGRYSVDKVLNTASTTYQNITDYGGSAGSAYTLDVDFSSPLGILLAIPTGINLTLFRPYPWEYLKPFILFASAESMLILYFTLLCFFKGGFGKALRLIWNTPILQFCLLFSFLFAFMTGVSAANFGTLVRYKIPCLPFYLLFLAILWKLKFPPKPLQRPRSISPHKRVHSS